MLGAGLTGNNESLISYSFRSTSQSPLCRAASGVQSRLAWRRHSARPGTVARHRASQLARALRSDDTVGSSPGRRPLQHCSGAPLPGQTQSHLPGREDPQRRRDSVSPRRRLSLPYRFLPVVLTRRLPYAPEPDAQTQSNGARIRTGSESSHKGELTSERHNQSSTMETMELQPRRVKLAQF